VLHANMHGKIIVMQEADFSRWVEENRPKEGGAV
jgi:heme/copper-type cytochrome/quinol oxidase subunit 2